MPTANTKLAGPFDLALSLAHSEADEIHRDFMLQDAAVCKAEKSDYSGALKLCHEISIHDFRLSALLKTSMVMLKNGQFDISWRTLDQILAECGNGTTDFLYDELLPQLEYLCTTGWRINPRDILLFALDFAYSNGANFRGERKKLHALKQTLVPLAVYWREKAEEVIDYILEQPLACLDECDGYFSDGRCVLFDVALIIEKHGLVWDNERLSRFLKHYKTHEEFINAYREKSWTTMTLSSCTH